MKYIFIFFCTLIVFGCSSCTKRTHLCAAYKSAYASDANYPKMKRKRKQTGLFEAPVGRMYGLRERHVSGRKGQRLLKKEEKNKANSSGDE